MTRAGTHRRRPRARRWLPALAVVTVLAVIGGVLWLLAPSPDAEPAGAIGAATATSATASTTLTTPPPPSPRTPPPTSVPTATTAAPATTTSPGPAPVVEVPAPAPVPVPVPAPVPAPAPAPAADPGVETEVLGLVNAERAAAGCGAVSGDGGLAGVARAHSADMRDRGFFSHTSPEGLSPFDRAAAAGVSGSRAENIAQGQPDAASVMAAWMASPGHRANILDCSLTRLGVGVAQGAGGPWWTQLFGS